MFYYLIEASVRDKRTQKFFLRESAKITDHEARRLAKNSIPVEFRYLVRIEHVEHLSAEEYNREMRNRYPLLND